VLVLASTLLASFGKVSAQLLAVTETTAKHAELIERLTHFLRFTSALAIASTPVRVGSPHRLCEAPSTETTVGVLVISGSTPACLSLSGRRVDTAVLVIDTLSVCEASCRNVGLPAYLWFEPGCHPLFQITQPELLYVLNRSVLELCNAQTKVFHWQRHVMYLRDYAWQAADGRGAIMIKKLKNEGVYTRSEMLVSDVLGWQFSERPYQLSVAMHAEGAKALGQAGFAAHLPVSLHAWVQSLRANTEADLVQAASVALAQFVAPAPEVAPMSIET